MIISSHKNRSSFKLGLPTIGLQIRAPVLVNSLLFMELFSCTIEFSNVPDLKLRLKTLLLRFMKFIRLLLRACKILWPNTRQVLTKSSVMWILKKEILCGLY